MDFEKLVNYLENMAIIWGPKVLIAILILIVGLRIIGWISKLLNKNFQRRRIDPSVYKFLVSIINVFLKVMLLLTVASQVGIPTTSFVAIISASALAIGLALSGNLSHFASGVLILIFKPYKIADLIKVGDHTGNVAEIQIFNTILTTTDNKKIIIPNSVITSGAIVNISTEGLMRADMHFSIDAGQDIDKARDLIINIMKENKMILSEPEAKVFVQSLTNNSIDLAVYPWIDPDNYWDVIHDIQERVKKSFVINDIEGPQNNMGIFRKKLKSES